MRPYARPDHKLRSELEHADDNIYYNIAVRHVDPDGVTTRSNLNDAEFKVERTIPILRNPKEYYITIERFSIPLNQVPLMIIPIQDNQANINLTPMSVTLSFGGLDHQVFINYVTQNINEPLPPPPIPNQVVNSYYYMIYEYTHFIGLFNTAFATAYANMQASASPSPQQTAPYFIFNPETRLISLIAEYSYSQPAQAEIFVNFQTFSYFEAILNEFHGANQPNGKDAKYIIRDQGGLHNAYYPPGQVIPAPVAFPAQTAPNFLEMKQEYPNLITWSSIASIIVTSTTMPIVKEWEQSNATESGVPIGNAILTDFEPLLGQGGEERTIVQYFPQGPRRLINLNSTIPLREFDFKIWWKDKKGRVYPLKIPFEQEITIKFLFTKKATYTG